MRYANDFQLNEHICTNVVFLTLLNKKGKKKKKIQWLPKVDTLIVKHWGWKHETW